MSEEEIDNEDGEDDKRKSWYSASVIQKGDFDDEDRDNHIHYG